MNNKGNLGEKISNIVQDAVDNKNFNSLNKEIGNAIDSALEEVRKAINSESKMEYWKSHKMNHQKNQQSNNGTKAYQYQMNHSTQGHSKNYQAVAKVRSGNYMVPIGQASNVLCTIFGVLCTALFGIAVLVLFILGYSWGFQSHFHMIAYGLTPGFLGGIFLCNKGSRIRARLKRFQRYNILMQGKNYGVIRDFASATGMSYRNTVKDLRKMINIGMYPQGHIDVKKTCFMLNHESYEQYQKLQDQMNHRIVNNQNSIVETKQEDNKDTSLRTELSPEVRKAIEEGRQYIAKIKIANDVIPGEEISMKLERLETVTRKIYDYVESHPDKIAEIKKFTEYFIPTTMKLIEAYKELEIQPAVGMNIATAKQEIEATLDTINLAFENLLDGFFEDVAMDISTDISVLETMLAQEGLTERKIKEMQQ